MNEEEKQEWKEVLRKIYESELDKKFRSIKELDSLINIVNRIYDKLQILDSLLKAEYEARKQAITVMIRKISYLISEIETMDLNQFTLQHDFVALSSEITAQKEALERLELIEEQFSDKESLESEIQQAETIDEFIQKHTT